MRISRNSIASALLAVLLAGPAALAQTGAPVRLAPPPNGVAYPPPPGTAPGSGYAPPAPPSSGITVDQLAPPSPDSAGAIDLTSHGFPATLWQGSNRATVLALLPKIGSTTSPALQELAYRLLASTASPPAGTAEGSLLGLRAERLTNALGRADTALALLQSLPPAQRGEDLAKVSVDLAFLSDDHNSACSQIRDRDHGWQSPYWTYGQITCQALDGDGTGAQLGLDMMREQKLKDDGFVALVLHALGNDAKLSDALPSPQPMALALLEKANLAVPKKAFDTAKLPVLVAVANGSGFPAEQRVFAAEKAAAYGAIVPDALAAAYLATPLDDEDQASPINRADSAGGAKGRAILFRAAHDATAFQAKANFLQSLLLKAPREVYPAVIRAAQQMLLDLPASPEAKPLATDFARALFALDHPKEARQWLDLADPAQAATVLPLAHVAAGTTAPAWTDMPLADLVGGGSKKDPTAGQKRATLLVQLLAAEGAPVPDSLVVPLLDAKIGGPGSVGPGLLIESESSGKHLGGTVLAVLAALGDDGAAGPSQTVAQSIAALRRVGLADDARRLAIDAALAAGF